LVINESVGGKIFNTINTFFLILLSAICLYPIIHVLFASFSEPLELMKHRGLLMKPLGFTVNGYILVFKNPNIINGYINTLFYVIVGTALNLLLTSMGAYALSRRNILWKNAMMFCITFTMFFGGGLIPTYLLVKSVGLINTRWALIIPGLIGTYNLIIMRTSFAAIPDSLEESAKIDGANDFTVLFKIIMPVSKAVLAVILLFYAVGHWNAWFNAMIYLRDRKLFPLQLILREILISNDLQSMSRTGGQAAEAMTQANADTVYLSRVLVQYCTIIVATVPILLLYPFVQKYFVKGVMIGSLKG